jgi:recombination protein RecT
MTQALTVVLDKMEPQIAAALPPGIPAKRFVRAVKSMVQLNPSIGDLERTSVLGCVMQSAQMGLVLDGKEAAAIPFKGKAVFVPMVAGLRKLIRQHSNFADMDYGIVYQREIDEGRFTHIKGNGKAFRHEPIYFGEKGEALGSYAYVTTKDGDIFVSVLEKDEIEKRLSKGMQSQMKKEFWQEFWIKTAIRAVYKKAPNAGDENGFLDGVFKDDDEPRDITAPISDTQNLPPHDADGVILDKPAKVEDKPKTTRAAAAVMAQVEDVPFDYTPPQYEDDEIPM